MRESIFVWSLGALLSGALGSMYEYSHISNTSIPYRPSYRHSTHTIPSVSRTGEPCETDTNIPLPLSSSPSGAEQSTAYSPSVDGSTRNTTVAAPTSTPVLFYTRSSSSGNYTHPSEIAPSGSHSPGNTFETIPCPTPSTTSTLSASFFSEISYLIPSHTIKAVFPAPSDTSTGSSAYPTAIITVTYISPFSTSNATASTTSGSLSLSLGTIPTPSAALSTSISGTRLSSEYSSNKPTSCAHTPSGYTPSTTLLPYLSSSETRTSVSTPLLSLSSSFAQSFSTAKESTQQSLLPLTTHPAVATSSHTLTTEMNPTFTQSPARSETTQSASSSYASSLKTATRRRSTSAASTSTSGSSETEYTSATVLRTSKHTTMTTTAMPSSTLAAPETDIPPAPVVGDAVHLFKGTEKVWWLTFFVLPLFWTT